MGAWGWLPMPSREPWPAWGLLWAMAKTWPQELKEKEKLCPASTDEASSVTTDCGFCNESSS